MKKIITVKVIPKSSQRKIEKHNLFYKVWLKTAPEKGKANSELVNLLANYFQVQKSAISIISGTKIRKKLVEINL